MGNWAVSVSVSRRPSFHRLVASECGWRTWGRTLRNLRSSTEPALSLVCRLARRALDLHRGHLDHHLPTNILGTFQIQHVREAF